MDRLATALQRIIRPSVRQGQSVRDGLACLPHDHSPSPESSRIMTDMLKATLQKIIRPEDLADWLNDHYAELSARAGYPNHIAHCIDVDRFDRQVGLGWEAKVYIIHRPRGGGERTFADLSRIFAGFPVKVDDVRGRVFLADEHFPHLAVFQRLAGVF